MAIFRVTGFPGYTIGGESPGRFLREPAEIAVLVLAGVAFIALSQIHRAAMAARTREVSPIRVWREVFGSETEVVTSGALITVFILALFCYEVLGYRGLLLCVMPLLFVRDGSRRYLELRRAQARAEVEKTAAVAADLATAGLDEARFAELLIVPEVRFLEPEAGSEAGTPVVTAHAAEGTKCPRCWQVKRDGDETGLCARCRGILATGPTAASA